MYKLRKINLRPRSSPRKKPYRNFCGYEIKVGVGATYVDYTHKYMMMYPGRGDVMSVIMM